MKSSDHGRRQFLRQFVQYTGLAALGAIVLPHAQAALAPGKLSGPLAPAQGLKIPGWRCWNCLWCNHPNALFCEQCLSDYGSGSLPPCDYPECGGGATKPVRPDASGARK